MAALRVLEEQHVVAEFLHAGRHLARVAGMDAVVARRRGEEDARVAGLAPKVVVGRPAAHELPVGRVVGVAVLAHPRGPGEQPVVAPHVEQRHLADHGAEELREERRHVAHEQGAIAATHDPEAARRGDAARGQVARHGGEVLVAAHAAASRGRLMPARPVFAAAPDVRDRVGAAFLQPGRADDRVVAGQHRHLEPAIAGEQRRRPTIAAHVAPRDQEIGHARPVGRGDEALLHLEAAGVEERGQRLQRPCRAAPDRVAAKARRRQEVRGGQPVLVALLGIDGRRADGAERGQAGQRRAAPRAIGEAPGLDARLHVVERGDEDMRARRRPAGQRGRRRRREEHVEAARAGDEVVEAAGEQRAGRMRLAIDRPVVAQREQEPLAVRPRHRAVGLVEPYHLPVAQPEDLGAVEGEHAHHEVALAAARVVADGVAGDMRRLALGERRRAGEVRPAAPGPGDARIAGGRQRSRPEIRAHEELVAGPPRDLALGFGQEETVLDEALRPQVEFPHDHGIRAAARQQDQGARVARGQDMRALPDPVLSLVAAERVEVEHDLPGGIGPSVFLVGGTAPQPSRMGRVLP